MVIGKNYKGPTIRLHYICKIYILLILRWCITYICCCFLDIHSKYILPFHLSHFLCFLIVSCCWHCSSFFCSGVSVWLLTEDVVCCSVWTRWGRFSLWRVWMRPITRWASCSSSLTSAKSGTSTCRSCSETYRYTPALLLLPSNYFRR